MYRPARIETFEILERRTDLENLTTYAATFSRMQWRPDEKDNRMSRYSGRHRIMGSSHKVALVMTVLETG